MSGHEYITVRLLNEATNDLHPRTKALLKEAAVVIRGRDEALAAKPMSYDDHPTDPRHGGKLTSEQMAERIKELEAVVKDFLALERCQTPSMSGKRRTFGYISPGASLAVVLDAARALVGHMEM